MERPANFSAGPAAIPLKVLKKAQEEFLNFADTGMSLMEISHRSKAFSEVMEKTRKNLHTLLNIPDNYEVLFFQGGAHYMFSAVPLNILGDKKKADYIITGNWSNRAYGEAQKYLEANIVCKPDEYNRIPDRSEWKLDPEAAYVYYCDNETVMGVEFNDIPDTGDVPIVCDMSSNFLSRPFDVSKFGVVFACAQKNFGMAGLTIAIVRRDLIGMHRKDTPLLLTFERQMLSKSMFNTPTTYAIYIANLIFEWMIEEGGLEHFDEYSKKKSSLLYDYIDNSNGFYTNPVDKAVRSRMNVRFNIVNPEWEAEWLEKAAERKLLNLKGHRSVGGFRASIYNAVTYESVEKLVQFMKDFQEMKEKEMKKE